jgi:hypothetical protein
VSLQTIPVPGLYNGVSRQSPTVRSPEQGEGQTNGWSSLAQGLQKRPPSSHVAKLLNSSAITAYTKEINRDATERYIVVAVDGRLRVFGLDGSEKTVTAPDGWGYLASATDYAADLTMTTVADYTFVVNRKVSPALKPIPVGSPDPIPDYYVPPERGSIGDYEYSIP